MEGDVDIDNNGVVIVRGFVRQQFDGKVDGADPAINAITTKWVDGEIDDTRYGELLDKLRAARDPGGLKPLESSAASPAKRRRKNSNGNGKGSSILSISFLLLSFILSFFSLKILFLF